MADEQQVSKAKIAAYKKLFLKFRSRKSSHDDVLMRNAHNDVFAKTNCLDCAQCCKTHSPLFNRKDIERIAGHLKIRPADFVSRYLIIDEDDDWIFHTVPCPFLLNTNACSIYAERPDACRDYPHTNRKKIYQLESITLKNAEICPAVVKILDTVLDKINQQK